MPVFHFIESVDDSNPERDEIQEQFLNDIFVNLEYKTYSPGETLIRFSDPADRMLIFVSGR